MSAPNPRESVQRFPRARVAEPVISAVLLLCCAVAACAAPRNDAAMRDMEPIESGRDYHSLANVDDFRVAHLALDLTADFPARQLRGHADLTIDTRRPGAKTLVLDTRELDVSRVTLVAGEKTTPLAFEIGAARLPLGSPLEISLPAAPLPDRFVVRVTYASSPDASGLQWLQPTQTAGKAHPFLYSQSQAIHARSWVPLQDSPQVRFTYEAVVRVPVPLRAVMSADNDPASQADGVYRFRMPQPIPSYLLAIAVGDLAFEATGPRTGVYAEPSVVASAAREFADTERMVQACERLFGPYRWGRYDLLILPPSFPFGGMENPRLSFITPTVIAGDRSLVAMIAHELAHSWSGNLVTNATWRDFWLNEGFTVLLERRIMEAVYGERRAAMEDLLGFQTLQRDLAAVPPAEQILAIDLRGRDPDDGVTEIPYEKGRFFLGWLESRIGRPALNDFVQRYFGHFEFRSITTEQFRAFLDRELAKNHPGKVTKAELDRWMYEPGLPPDAPRPVSDAFTRVDSVRAAFLAGKSGAADLPAGEWTTQEWLYFLGGLPERLPRRELEALDREHGLTASSNAEIAMSWLVIAIRNDYEPADARVRDYLVTIGRRKLIEPLYEALMATPEGAARARSIYAEARPGYHSISRTTIDSIVR